MQHKQHANTDSSRCPGSIHKLEEGIDMLLRIATELRSKPEDEASLLASHAQQETLESLANQVEHLAKLVDSVGLPLRVCPCDS